MKDNLESLRALDREIVLLGHTSAILSWDQETYMPDGAVEHRAEQLSLLQGALHARIVSPEMKKALDAAESAEAADETQGGPDETDRALLRECRRRYLRNKNLPEDFVRELARQTSLAQSRWREARKRSEFSLFAPSLKTLVELTRRKTEYIGFDDDPYDALLDEYEPYMKTAEVHRIFSSLQKPLSEMVEGIQDSKSRNDGDDRESALLHGSFDEEKQRALSAAVLEAMGFDFRRGRLDVSAHPFTTTLGPSDVRLTTRYAREEPSSSLFSSVHEGGHGLYELGFSARIAGTVLGDGASLGIHESQSRMWENLIGRSLPFWRWLLPRAKELFPDQLAEVDPENAYRAVNRVEPSLIRVESDEVTYNLHIVLRFQLETELLGGRLSVQDLPEAWRSKSRDLLGIRPDTDTEGVLQDIHWSMGAFGYFPTYCLGNLYAAQFFAQMEAEIPELWGRIEKGDLYPVLDWLRSRVHAHGRVYPAEELCRRITGSRLTSDPFLAYLRRKYGEIYGI